MNPDSVNQRSYDLQSFSNSNHVLALNRIVRRSGEPLEGNCLYQHHSGFLLHRDNKEGLRKNLFQLARNKTSILEVGFNAGHSVALFFYANPIIRVLAFDLCYHKYTEECYEYLSKNLDLRLVKGDSTETIRNYRGTERFDIIHIDGGHSVKVLFRDIVNCRRFAHRSSLLIVDDAYSNGIKKLLRNLLKVRCLSEIDYEQSGLFKTKYHRIFRYNSSKLYSLLLLRSFNPFYSR